MLLDLPEDCSLGFVSLTRRVVCCPVFLYLCREGFPGDPPIFTPHKPGWAAVRYGTFYMIPSQKTIIARKENYIGLDIYICCQKV